MKLIKRIMTILLFGLMVFLLVGSSLAGELERNTREPNKTITESDFSDHSVMIVFDRETSLQFKSYTADDFPEIDCIGVRDLTIESETMAQDEVKQGIDHNEIAFNKILCLELGNPGKENVIEAISVLCKKEHIIAAGPDYVISIASEPNDQFYDDQWACERINLPGAWNAATGSSTVLVGVVDSGIDGIHSDLYNRIKKSLCRKFINGFSEAETAPTDQVSHGTHVAGIIGAEGNNNLGVCGVCWNVRLVSLKVVNEMEVGYASNVVLAISYANSKNIKILNMSIVWNPDGTHPEYYYVPVETAMMNYNGLIVCAAGNESSNIDSSSYTCYPPEYTLNNMIVVGNSGLSDTKRPKSNYGTVSVDIFAPGYNILSTYPAFKCSSGSHNSITHYQEGYHYGNGTSMSAPFVTGVAALIKSCHPSITVSQLKDAILNHGDYRSALSNYCVTGRRLNAFKALDSTHSYTYIDYGNSLYHRCHCSICGYTVNRSHNWVADHLNGQYYCSICGATTESPVYNTIIGEELR